MTNDPESRPMVAKMVVEGAIPTCTDGALEQRIDPSLSATGARSFMPPVLEDFRHGQAASWAACAPAR